MHEMVHTVAKTKRGQINVVKAYPGRGIVTALTDGLSDYGMESREIKLFQAYVMGEARFVEFLNEVRLRDEILILSGVTKGPDKALDLVQFNVEHCFTRHGGRAVMVVYGD